MAGLGAGPSSGALHTENSSENKIAFGPVCKELGAGDGIAPANQASEFTTEFDVFRFAIG